MTKLFAVLVTGEVVEVDHVLKTWPVAFHQIETYEKTHEYRVNDRGFRRGQHVLLREFVPANERYTGAHALVRITSISYGPEWGIPKGYAVFSIRDVPIARVFGTISGEKWRD